MRAVLSLQVRRAEWPARLSWMCGAAGVVLLSWRAMASLLLPLSALGCGIYLLAAVYYPELNLLLYYIPGKIGFEERLELRWGISANQIFQILFGLALVLKLSRRRFGPGFPWVTVASLVALCSLMLAGLLHSDNTSYGTFKAFSYTFLVLPGVVFLGLHVERPLLLRRFLLIFFGIALGMTLLGLRHIGTLQHGDRLAVFGGGANVYSRMVGCGLLLLMTCAVNLHRMGRARQAWLLVGAMSPGFLVAMYFAGSKGPMLALFLSLLFLAAINGFLRRTLVAVLMVTVAFLVAQQQSRGFDDTVKLISASRLFLNPAAEISYGSYGSRLDHYKYSAERFASSPLVGVGTGGWGSNQTLFEERSYPHNMFVELACELGLVGVVLVGAYGVWLAKQIWALLRRARGSADYTMYAGVAACLFFWFLNVQVSGDVVDNRNLWVFAALSEIAVRLVGHDRGLLKHCR